MQPTTSLSAKKTALYNSFRTTITKLAREKESVVEADLENKYRKGKAAIEQYMKVWLRVSNGSKTLYAAGKHITDVSNWENEVKEIEEAFKMFNDEGIIKFEMKKIFLESLESRLSYLVSKVPSFRNFINLPVDNVSAAALDHFVKIGSSIVEDSLFPGSNIAKLDSLLYDMKNRLNTELAAQCHGHALVSDRTFVALAAPSMEGKTQAAFAFRKVRTLYFPLIEATDNSSSQLIYRNFRSHAKELRACALLDLAMLDASSESDITTTKLTDDFKSCDFWTVGFLKGLVNRKINTKNWMSKYANKEEFKFRREKISEVKIKFFLGFCLFLDEFSCDDLWMVFVRNLARSMNLLCICSNTNTRVANIVGRTTSSGEGGKNVWSVVVVKLNSPSIELLDKFFNLKTAMNVIKNAATDGESGQVCQFLDDFKKEQLKSLRPGVALYVAKSLQQFAEDLKANPGAKTVTLGRLLDCISFQLYVNFYNRKPSLASEDLSFYAKICLFYPESYSTGNEAKNVKEFFNQNAFLEHHLYYLKNPQALGSWIFVTIPPDAKANSSALRTITGQNNFPDWDDEYTFFDPNDLFTIMGCIFIPFKKTPTALLKVAREKTAKTSRSAAANSMNRKAMSLPGAPLEVSVAVSVVDATQHTFEYRDVDFRDFRDGNRLKMTAQYRSFAGVSGVDFVKNLVLNLISDSSFELKFEAYEVKRVDVSFLERIKYDLAETFLTHCKFPFLYGIDHEIPIFDRLSRIGTDFFTEAYQRSDDEDEIDGSFHFSYKGQLRKAVVECKNRQKRLPADVLASILEKAQKNAAFLTLIFCNESAESPDTTSRLFDARKSKTYGANLYRVMRLNAGHFRIVPFFPDFKGLIQNPKMICLIFESKRINPTSSLAVIRKSEESSDGLLRRNLKRTKTSA